MDASLIANIDDDKIHYDKDNEIIKIKANYTAMSEHELKMI